MYTSIMFQYRKNFATKINIKNNKQSPAYLLVPKKFGYHCIVVSLYSSDIGLIKNEKKNAVAAKRCHAKFCNPHTGAMTHTR